MRREYAQTSRLAHAATSVLLADLLAATDEPDRWHAMALYVDLHGWIEGCRDARVGEGV